MKHERQGAYRFRFRGARRGSGLLRAKVIGSCVIVAAYDPAAAVGGMAHVMPPGSSPNGASHSKTHYAENAAFALG
jgi:chemotaxis receptor (MCP) glutamine deamidase CheD